MASTEFEVEVQVNTKAAIQQITEASETALTQLVDLYCELRQTLDPEIEALKLKTKELTEVEVQLLASIDEFHPSADDGTLKTTQWLLGFAAKGKVFQLNDKKKLIELIGIDAFLELAEVSVTNLRKHLTAKQLTQIGEDVHKTKRKLTYAPKPA